MFLRACYGFLASFLKEDLIDQRLHSELGTELWHLNVYRLRALQHGSDLRLNQVRP